MPPADRAQPVARRPGFLGPTLSATLLSLLLFGMTAVGWVSLPRSPAAGFDVLSAIWLNIVLMLIAVTFEARRRPYSLHLMHLISMFLFLGVASLLQYSVGYLGVAGPITAIQPEILPTVASVTLWLVGYLAAYEIQRALARRPRGGMVRFLSRSVTPLRALIVLAFALLSLVYLAAAGLAGASTRGGAERALSEYTLEGGAGSYSVAFYLIHHVMLRAFSLVALLAALLLLVRQRRTRNPLFLLFTGTVGLGTLLANNPFAAARMWLATAVIGFAAPFYLRRRRTGWGLVLIALGGIAFLPALHETRYLETLDEAADYFALVSPLDYLARNSDVDSLGMVSLCVRWLESHEHRLGLQTLGAFLFWFPRTLWPDKPIETGAMVTRDLGFEFTNLAPPIMSDPLVDFGLLGVPVFAAVFGVLLARLDRSYWDVETDPSQVRLIDCIYPFWLGCVLFMTRGGSFASLSFTVAFTLWIVPLGAGVARGMGVAPRTLGVSGSATGGAARQLS